MAKTAGVSAHLLCSHCGSPFSQFNKCSQWISLQFCHFHPLRHKFTAGSLRVLHACCLIQETIQTASTIFHYWIQCTCVIFFVAMFLFLFFCQYSVAFCYLNYYCHCNHLFVFQRKSWEIKPKSMSNIFEIKTKKKKEIVWVHVCRYV